MPAVVVGRVLGGTGVARYALSGGTSRFDFYRQNWAGIPFPLFPRHALVVGERVVAWATGDTEVPNSIEWPDMTMNPVNLGRDPFPYGGQTGSGVVALDLHGRTVKPRPEGKRRLRQTASRS